MLLNLTYVDDVIPESNWNQKENDIKIFDVSVVVMGSDWAGDQRFEKLRPFCDVKYIYRPHIISTTVLKNYITIQGLQS